MQWLNGRTMNVFVGQELDKRFPEYQTAEGKRQQSNIVIDLILQAYLSTATTKSFLDSTFRTFAIHQIRLFAFVGQGSTTATLVYAIHLLSNHPKSLAQLRAEHEEVLGVDTASIAWTHCQQPHLLNRLRFTKAVIKETMRLYPAASEIRQGKAGCDLVETDGTRFSTENCYVWVLHWAMQRSAAQYPEPHAFLPERWLVERGHALYLPKSAWRTFGIGPRKRPAQDLVATEITVALAMLIREFEFENAYEEWDKAHAKPGPKIRGGDRVYQTERGGARPVDGYPCRVSLRRI